MSPPGKLSSSSCYCSARGQTVGDIRLRPHHLLCIQGFRGQGYSSGFIANLARLVEHLKSKPESNVRIVEGADDICAACPHMENDDCQRFGKNALEMDAKLKQALDLTEGAVEPWFMLVDSVRDAITPDNLYQFCGHCNWKNLNYCTDGIAALRAGDRDD